MADVVALEARKYIPVPLNEVFLDFSVIPTEESYTEGSDVGKAEKRGVEVLVVAIHNEYLSEYQSVMAGSALQPGFYEIEIFSSIRAVVDQGLSTVMIIDMGARSTKLYIVERGLHVQSQLVDERLLAAALRRPNQLVADLEGDVVLRGGNDEARRRGRPAVGLAGGECGRPGG